MAKLWKNGIIRINGAINNGILESKMVPKISTALIFDFDSIKPEINKHIDRIIQWEQFSTK